MYSIYFTVFMLLFNVGFLIRSINKLAISEKANDAVMYGICVLCHLIGAALCTVSILSKGFL